MRTDYDLRPVYPPPSSPMSNPLEPDSGDDIGPAVPELADFVDGLICHEAGLNRYLCHTVD